MEGRVIAVVLRVDVASLVDEPVRHVCVPLEDGEVGTYYLHIKLLFAIIIYLCAPRGRQGGARCAPARLARTGCRP